MRDIYIQEKTILDWFKTGVNVSPNVYCDREETPTLSNQASVYTLFQEGCVDSRPLAGFMDEHSQLRYNLIH